jgi:hypothetical protein
MTIKTIITIVMIVGFMIGIMLSNAIPAEPDDIQYLDMVKVVGGFYEGYEGQVVASYGAEFKIALKVPTEKFGTRLHYFNIIYCNIAEQNLKIISKADKRL